MLVKFSLPVMSMILPTRNSTFDTWNNFSIINLKCLKFVYFTTYENMYEFLSKTFKPLLNGIIVKFIS